MSEAAATYDPKRARMALSMVSVLFNGQVPPIGTDISDITGLPKVQIAWQARLNGPLSQMAGQAGFGWHHVDAAEIGNCTFIENLIALVYGKLVSPQSLTAEDHARHTEHIVAFVSDVNANPVADGEPA
jgi:hypothetical protein